MCNSRAARCVFESDFKSPRHPSNIHAQHAVKSEANLGARHFEIERITAD